MRYSIVLYQTDLATGLNSKDYSSLLNNMTSATGIEPLHVHSNVTSAYGFYYPSDTEGAGISEEEIRNYVESIIANSENENPTGVYELRNGIKMYIGYPRD